MPTWWNSFETVTDVTWWLRWVSAALTITGGLCVIATLATSKRAETLKMLRQPGRTLLEVQQRQILDVLANQPNGEVKIVCLRSSPEPRKYGLEFVSVLTEAGWSVSVDDRAVMLQPPTNLQVRVHSDGPKAVRTRGDMPNRAASLYDALRLAGLPVSLKYDETIPKEEVWLVVGIKE